MRTIFAPAMLMVLVAARPARAQAPAPRDALNEEIRLLRQRVEALERTVGELRESLRRLEPGSGERALPKAVPIAPDELQGVNRAALAKIKLEEEPTREDLEQYVLSIVQASRGQNQYSSGDHQVGMLRRVGRKNADLLIELWDAQTTFYFEAALTQLAGEEHKQKVIAWLPIHPALVKVVLKKGWERDAREVLIQGIRGRPDYLPTEWIDAVARLRDPETYPALVDYFVEGLNRSWTYKSLRSLPGIDLDRAVARAWSGGDAFHSFGREELAPIAMAHGHSDALPVVFAMLEGADQHRAGEARRAIRAHTDASGTNEELRAWYEKYRNRLRWSKERGKFIASDEE